MMPTPNDTKPKQLCTALAITVMFAVAGLAIFLMFKLAFCLLTSLVVWQGICGMILMVTAILAALVYLVAAVLSMLDWMRSTTHHYSHPERMDNSDLDGLLTLATRKEV